MQNILASTGIDTPIPLVKGNRIQIQQVLVNLIQNCIQAMTHIPKEDRRLKIEATHDSSNLKLWVSDNGSGIEAEKIDEIFEPMKTWKPDGTGMGLAISYSIIEMHGGSMWAENRPKGGAVVGFELPLPKGDKEQ